MASLLSGGSCISAVPCGCCVTLVGHGRGASGCECIDGSDRRSTDFTMKVRADLFFPRVPFWGRVGLASKQDAGRVVSSPLRMAPRILFESFGRWCFFLFESFGRWRPARGGSLDEVGAVCFMRSKHSWTHRTPHNKGIKNEGPAANAECPDAQILPAMQV